MGLIIMATAYRMQWSGSFGGEKKRENFGDIPGVLGGKTDTCWWWQQ